MQAPNQIEMNSLRRNKKSNMKLSPKINKTSPDNARPRPVEEKCTEVEAHTKKLDCKHFSQQPWRDFPDCTGEYTVPSMIFVTADPQEKKAQMEKLGVQYLRNYPDLEYIATDSGLFVFSFSVKATEKLANITSNKKELKQRDVYDVYPILGEKQTIKDSTSVCGNQYTYAHKSDIEKSMHNPKTTNTLETQTPKKWKKPVENSTQDALSQTEIQQCDAQVETTSENFTKQDVSVQTDATASLTTLAQTAEPALAAETLLSNENVAKEATSETAIKIPVATMKEAAKPTKPTNQKAKTKQKKVTISKNRPRQCYNCLQWGHTAEGCMKPVKCNRCAGNHHHSDCMTDRNNPHCGNCGEGHQSSAFRCKERPRTPRKTNNDKTKSVTSKQIITSSKVDQHPNREATSKPTKSTRSSYQAMPLAQHNQMCTESVDLDKAIAQLLMALLSRKSCPCNNNNTHRKKQAQHKKGRKND